MGFWDKLFGGRRRAKEQAHACALSAKETLARGDAIAAFGIACSGLVYDAANPELLAVAGDAIALRGNADMGERFHRAADAPHDVDRLFNLGTALLSMELPEIAVLVLHEALLLAPFDAIVRSELALAYAHLGQPTEVVSTLALHPCLADDAGALFSFAWASLLSGDIEVARSSMQQLLAHREAAALVLRLEAALERSTISPDNETPDARDYYFLEYGGVVLSLAKENAGRFGALDVDAEVLADLLGRAAFALDAMGASDRPCVPINDDAHEIAETLAKSLGTYVTKLPVHGRLPRMILVARDAADFEGQLDRFGTPSEVITFALTLSWRSGHALAPDLVGALVDITRHSASNATPSEFLDPALSLFLTKRKKMLPAADLFAHAAYAPDAPLPRPTASTQKK